MQPLPQGLPSPVERFYRQICGDRVPAIDSAVLTGRAKMRIMGITFPARFRFTHDAGEGYRHAIEATIFGLPLKKVNETYLNGESRLELPSGVEEGPKVDQAANQPGTRSRNRPMPPSTSRSDPSPAEAEGRLARTAGYYLAFIALGLVTGSLGPTLAALSENVGAGLDQISGLFTAGALGYLIGSLLGGRAYDRAPGHTVMGGVLLLMALLMASVPLVPWLWLLFSVMLLVGATSGTVDAGGNTLLVWLHGEDVGPFMNGLHFFFGIGAFLSPIIIAQAVRLGGGITGAYWVLALLIALAALWILRLPNPIAHASPGDDLAARSDALIVVLVAIVLMLYVGAESSVGGWIYTYASSTGLSNETQAAYLTSLFWGVLAAGRLLSIPLAKRFSPRTLLLADWLGCLVSMAVMVLASDASLAVWAGTFGAGLSMASIFPLMLAFAGQRMSITGRITGWFLVGAGAGGMTLPWLVGQLFESVGPRATMPAILIDLIIATGVFGVLMLYGERRRTRRARGD